MLIPGQLYKINRIVLMNFEYEPGFVWLQEGELALYLGKKIIERTKAWDKEKSMCFMARGEYLYLPGLVVEENIVRYFEHI